MTTTTATTFTVPLLAKRILQDTAACGFSTIALAHPDEALLLVQDDGVVMMRRCWRVEHNVDPHTGLPKVQCWTYVYRYFNAGPWDDWGSDVASIEIGVGIQYPPPPEEKNGSAEAGVVELTLVLEERDTDGAEAFVMDETAQIATEEDWRLFKDEVLARAIQTAKEELSRKRFDAWSDDETAVWSD